MGWNSPAVVSRKTRYCRWCWGHRPEEGGVWVERDNGRKFWRCGSCYKKMKQLASKKTDDLKKEYFGGSEDSETDNS